MPITLLGGLLAFFVLTGSAGHASAPDLPSYQVSLTAYNAVPGQTDSDPSTTASGAYSNPTVVAARSRDLADELPFGTIIAIEPPTRTDNCGYSLVGSTVGYRVIADTMNARFTDRVDVLLPAGDRVTVGDKEVSTARALGSCTDVTIRVVGKIDLTHASNLPKTQMALSALVNSSGVALAQ